MALAQVLDLHSTQPNKHHCVTDGGYQWCEKTRKCQRFWEEPCTTPTLAKSSPNFDRSFVSCKNKMYDEYQRQQRRYQSVIESDKSCQTIRKNLGCSKYTEDCNIKAWEQINNQKMVCSNLKAKDPTDSYHCSETKKESTKLYSMNNIDGTTDCNFNIGHATLSCLNSKNSTNLGHTSFNNIDGTSDCYSMNRYQMFNCIGQR